MVDLSGVDLLALLPGEYKRAGSTDGGEYAGPCPQCEGRDRFRIWPHADHPHYWCRKCGMWGDAIDYVRWAEPGLSFSEAKARLFGGYPIQNVSISPKQGVKPETGVRGRVVSEKWLKSATSAHRRYIEWWNYRAIIPPLVDQFRLGFAQPPGESWVHLEPALILPVFDCMGQCIALRARTKRSWLTPLGGKELYAPAGVKTGAPLWIVENCANVLLWLSNALPDGGTPGDYNCYEWTAAAPTTGAASFSPEWADRIAKAAPSWVFVAGDNDDAGRDMNKRWSAELDKRGVPHETLELTEKLEAEMMQRLA